MTTKDTQEIRAITQAQIDAAKTQPVTPAGLLAGLGWKEIGILIGALGLTNTGTGTIASVVAGRGTEVVQQNCTEAVVKQTEACHAFIQQCMALVADKE